MNKEEILLKSKNENRKGDELQRIHTDEGIFAGCMIPMMFLGILLIFNLIHGEIKIVSITINIKDFLGILIMVQSFITSLYCFYYSHKKSQLAFSIFVAIGFVLLSIKIFLL